jgi:hypothetical protein
MNSSFLSPVPSKSMESVEEGLSLKEKLLRILRSDPFINGLVALAIAVGFFHGWLKIKFPHPVTTFLFDGLLGLALVLTFLKLERRKSFIPPGQIGNALKAFYVVCVLYALLPFGPPLLASVAALRGWCFPTLMFCLGYHLTKSLQQVKAFFYILVILGVLTAAYGLQQSPKEIEQKMKEDENFALRYKFTYYDKGKGERQFRIFSTFISAGVFGMVMAYVAVCAIVLLSAPEANKKERLLLIAATLLMAYAVVLTGARSAFISLGLGFLVIAWHRRNFQNFILIPAAIYVAVKLAASVTGGAAVDRFSTLLKLEDVMARALTPTTLGWNYMMDNLLGGGLGKSGYSVPMFLWDKTGYDEKVWVDGDLGCLMIEMGIVGLLVFGRVVWAALRTSYLSLKHLQGTPLSTVALASAACFVIAIGTFPIGAPFLTIPTGAMVWFFLGTLQKLSDEYQPHSIVQTEPIAAPGAAGKKFLYYRPKADGKTGPRRYPRP